MLGAAQRDEGVPPLDWVPQYNPLRTFPQLREAVEAGRYRVMFIATPYELADFWGLEPGLLVCSFAEEGELYQKFADYADDLATRAKAFADPTRLIIMRLIRGFGMTNTEIADFIGVSRPTISEHVKILREAGFVISRKEGREMKHAYVNEAIWQFFDDLEETLDPAPRPEQD
jgi:DNA-binding transcriptional ArsR family regulator